MNEQLKVIMVKDLFRILLLLFFGAISIFLTQSCISKRFSITEVANRNGVEDGFLLFDEIIIGKKCESGEFNNYYVPNISGLLDSFPGKICKKGKWKECGSSQITMYFVHNGDIDVLTDTSNTTLTSEKLIYCKHYRDRLVKCERKEYSLSSLSKNYRDSLLLLKIPFHYKIDIPSYDTVGVYVYYPL